MGKETNIGWCDHTFNPWWGCDDAEAEPDSADRSPECRNCYARTFDHRLGGDHWGAVAPRRFFGDAYWQKPVHWNEAARKAGTRASVFCASMADWAEVHTDPAVRADQVIARRRMFHLISRTTNLDWLLLSKRPHLWDVMLPWLTPDAPWPNAFLGVTVGVARSAWRVDHLRNTPAAKRFVSCEPLLEHITAEQWDRMLGGPGAPIDWLIVGDESGRGRRPADLDWVRTARDAATKHGVKFFFKQWNGPLPGSPVPMRNNKIHLPMLDGQRWSEKP